MLNISIKTISIVIAQFALIQMALILYLFPQSLHIVLWMLKDYAWNAELIWLWLLATPPTVLIGIDFVVTTAVAGKEFLIHEVLP